MCHLPTPLLPTPLPMSCKTALFPSSQIFIFFLWLHFKPAQMCVFVFFQYDFGAEVEFVSSSPPFFLSSSLCLFLFVTLSHSLMHIHFLSLLCQPPLAKRVNVYFKLCAMHQPPPLRRSTEENTGRNQACCMQVFVCVCSVLGRAYSLTHNTTKHNLRHIPE